METFSLAARLRIARQHREEEAAASSSRNKSGFVQFTPYI